eukprot:Sspe_Gene.34225::Locus_16654_Transcript_1_1_Confidence_1.000_Length_1293::g.34225::m.34225
MCKQGEHHFDDWISRVDVQALSDDLREVGDKLRKGEGEEDERHLHRMMLITNILFIAGFVSIPLSPLYIFPSVFIAFAVTVRWCAVAHHVCHGGYHRSDKTGRYHRGTFAMGVRRAYDWLDWMLPEAWDVEHNTLHHYNTNERDDPDLVERNFEPIRDWDVSKGWKYLSVIIAVLTWKWLYYASNTWKHLVTKGRTLTPEEKERAEHPILIFQLYGKVEWNIIRPVTMFFRVYLPYIALRLVLPVVAVYHLLDEAAAWNAFANVCIAEVLANLHSFIIVVPNHAGEDLYSFSSHAKPVTPTFYLRQIISSADYHCGSDPNRPGWVNDCIDLVHGWLNYQIEHHLFPNLSMLSYRRAQPLVREVCRKHGVPYVQQPVWTRVRKTVDIMVGNTSMRPFPPSADRAADSPISPQATV